MIKNELYVLLFYVRGTTEAVHLLRDGKSWEIIMIFWCHSVFGWAAAKMRGKDTRIRVPEANKAILK